MNLSALQTATTFGTGPSVPMHQRSHASDFLTTLARAAAADSGETNDAARDAAEKLVASSLIMPLLQEVRKQPLDANLFDGGMAEDAFRQQLDQQFADRIVRSANFPLVDRIYETVTRAAAHHGTEVSTLG